MRTALIQQQLKHGDMIAIIPHHHTMYLGWLGECGVVFLVLTILTDIARRLADSTIDKRIYMVSAIIGVCLVVYLFVRFLSIYMDTFIILNNGMALFTRDGVMNYKTEFFDRIKVDTVQSQQNGLLDAALQRGSIRLKIDGEITYQFDNVPDPQKWTTRILTAKQHYLHTLDRHPQAQYMPAVSSYHDDKQEKVSLLVEALGELLEEYQIKKG